jgi:hypothetical protein
MSEAGKRIRGRKRTATDSTLRPVYKKTTGTREDCGKKT